MAEAGELAELLGVEQPEAAVAPPQAGPANSQQSPPMQVDG
jgi:hypothetical protein